MIEIQVFCLDMIRHSCSLSEEIQKMWAFCNWALMVLLERSCYMREAAWNEQNASRVNAESTLQQQVTLHC